MITGHSYFNLIRLKIMICHKSILMLNMHVLVWSIFQS